jgi:ABC-2 type transport system ATP-binding protein
VNAIEVVGLSKSFGEQSVLRDLNLTVALGSIYGLLGRNGAGKTTLLKSLIGLLIPDHGRGVVLGDDLTQEPAAHKNEIGYVAQGEILPGFATIQDLVEFESSLRPRWNSAALQHWLEREKLRPTRKARALSVGQRKRLELELVLAGDPTVLLMDEPLAGLDPVARSEVMERLTALVAGNDRTILLSSHILSDLERLCDRVGIMSEGRLAMEAPIDAFKSGAAVIVGGLGSSIEQTGVEDVVAEHRGSRCVVWIARGLSPETASTLRADGLDVTVGSLDDLGTALIRGLKR